MESGDLQEHDELTWIRSPMKKVEDLEESNNNKPSNIRHLAVIMFTDIVGYSSMMSQDESYAIDVIHRNRFIQKSMIEKFHGEWLKEMGDGILAMFQSAFDAKECALAIQKQIREECEFLVRIGIHLGDIIVEENDAFGDVVNIASRIQSIADPGGIYVSESVYNASKARKDYDVVDLGQIHLKNINYPMQIYALSGNGLPKPSIHHQRNGKATELLSSEVSDSAQKDLSIAVLPFKNLSPDKSNQYFADGVMGDMLNTLQQMHELRVISQTSVERYRDTNMSTPQIGQELSVNYLVEGLVRKAGDQIMITAQLINAREDKHLWADNFKSVYNTENLFDIQREIAEQIVSELRLNISTKRVAQLTRPTTHSKEAYDYYLRGMFHCFRMTKQDSDTAMQYFDLALAEDPNFARAYAGIAMAWGVVIQYGFSSPYKALPRLKEAAMKAVALDGSIPEVHFLLALLMHGWLEWNWEVAEREFKRAISLNPSYAEARIYYCHLLCLFGRFKEAEIQASRAIELEPFNATMRIIYAMYLNMIHQYRDAVDILQEIMTSDPTNHFALTTLRSSYHNLGSFEAALEIWKKSFQVKGDEEAIAVLEAGNKIGGYSLALQKVAELFVSRRDHKFVSPWQIATLYVRAGKTDLALDWLEKSLQEGDSNIIHIAADPIFDAMRDEPRFKALLTTMKLPHH